MSGISAAAPGEVTRWESAASLKALALEAGVWAVLGLAVIKLSDRLVGLIALAGPAAADVVDRSSNELALLLAGIVSAVAVSRIARVLWRAVRARTSRYRLSNRHLVVESGFFSKTVREINVKAIDDVMVRRSLLGRLVGVGEIAIVASEADDKGPRTRVRLPGVPDPRAVHALIREVVHESQSATAGRSR